MTKVYHSNALSERGTIEVPMTDQNLISPLPVEFIRRLTQLYGNSTNQILDTFKAPKPTTFRVNTIKLSVNEVILALNAQGFETEPVAWYYEAFILKSKTLRELTDTVQYTKGQIYIQNLSSMIPALVLAPKDTDKVLDICAAPGSKATQLAVYMKNRGRITANDSSRIRIYRLQANRERQDARSVRIVENDARSIWQKYPEFFDCTLADVPCSMEARFSCDQPDSYKDWSLKKIKDMMSLQKWILRSAISATKAGGTIVYSTCTLSPEENEQVIDWVLKKEKGNVQVVPIDLQNAPLTQGLVNWGDKKYHKSIVQTKRVTPSPTMEGFYIGKLTKIHSSIPKILTQE
mgnify:FL=1